MPPKVNNQLRLEKISLYDDTEITKWDEFVESHPLGTPYHLSCWLRTIQKTYLFEPVLYVYKEANGEMAGVFPFFLIKSFFTGTRFVSLPFSDYGGPLFKENINENELLSIIKKDYGSSAKYIEIRSVIHGDTDFKCHNYYKHHVLNLETDLDKIKQKINKRTIQYSIRKAEKAGVEIKEENSQYGMDEFCRLNTLTRKKHGVPSQPKIFFTNLLDNVILKGHGFILLAIYDSKVIASSFFLKFSKQIHYKFNASDPEYLKKLSANHLLTWTAIKKGISEKYIYMDFGRTSPDNHGLMRYKSMWGMDCFDVPYYYYPKIIGATSIKESGIHYRIMTSIWRSLPDAALEKISGIIYKHLG